MTVRSRFAPSPTGFMHLGGVRTALYEYLIAKQNNGSFILRIEDTDQERFVEGATEVIYDTLRACGLNWDEGPDVGGDYGPYIQSERKATYLPYAEQLVKSGHAYYCFCSKEEIEERRKAVEAAGGTWKYDKHCLHLTHPDECPDGRHHQLSRHGLRRHDVPEFRSHGRYGADQAGRDADL